MYEGDKNTVKNTSWTMWPLLFSVITIIFYDRIILYNFIFNQNDFLH